MCISDWLRRTFSAFRQYLYAIIYIIFIKIVTGSLFPVTILLFLSLMTLPKNALPFQTSEGVNSEPRKRKPFTCTLKTEYTGH